MTNFNRKESCELSSQKSTETNSGDQPNTKNSEYHKLMKQKDKIFRNAAIMGLVNTNKILLEDLINSNSKSCTKEEDRLKTLVNIKINIHLYLCIYILQCVQVIAKLLKKKKHFSIYIRIHMMHIE